MLLYSVRYKSKDRCNSDNKGCYLGKEPRNMNMTAVW